MTNETLRAARLRQVETHVSFENAHDLDAVMATFGADASYDDEPWAEHRRGRDEVRLPPAMAECLHRVSASQELTVEAAVTGSRDKVVEAMLLDPLAGRIDYDQVGEMTDEMLAATSAWLPQFAPV